MSNCVGFRSRGMSTLSTQPFVGQTADTQPPQAASYRTGAITRPPGQWPVRCEPVTIAAAEHTRKCQRFVTSALADQSSACLYSLRGRTHTAAPCPDHHPHLAPKVEVYGCVQRSSRPPSHVFSSGGLVHRPVHPKDAAPCLVAKADVEESTDAGSDVESVLSLCSTSSKNVRGASAAMCAVGKRPPPLNIKRTCFSYTRLEPIPGTPMGLVNATGVDDEDQAEITDRKGFKPPGLPSPTHAKRQWAARKATLAQARREARPLKLRMPPYGNLSVSSIAPLDPLLPAKKKPAFLEFQYLTENLFRSLNPKLPIKVRIADFLLQDPLSVLSDVPLAPLACA